MQVDHFRWLSVIEFNAGAVALLGDVADFPEQACQFVPSKAAACV